MTEDEFINQVVKIAKRQGFTIEQSRNGIQIDFGNKKLHAGHLRQLFPDILNTNSHIPSVIENIAPGRPCTHKPMREIIATIKGEG